jgi:ABC-type Fe3+/spermidine/putrescine transport system ATPase subunit
MSEPILELRHLDKCFGQTVAARNLSLAVMAGEFFTFLGPSGSGKSTILRMVAGLEQPDSGAILIDGPDISAAAPWDRNLGMMFQHYAIFPHMTVAENIAYGLKVRRIERAEIGRRVERMLALVGLGGLGAKRPTLLSGGEQQRVALARALAPEPRMLLLDEPLSALDERTRRLMQVELKQIHRNIGTTFLYVTHDQEEALTMSDRIVVLNHGVSMQCDAPEPLYKRPRTRFVAEFFRGCNVLAARRLTRDNGRIGIRLADQEIDLARPEASQTGEPIHLAVRSENVHFEPGQPQHAIRLAARLAEVTYRATVLDYRFLLADGQEITAMTTRHVVLPAEAPVMLSIDPADLVTLAD